MAKTSAALLLFRRRAELVEVLLGHPGGPFWARRDLGAWSIPKGEIGPGENAVVAARREFTEELGGAIAAGLPDHAPFSLGEAVQPSRKVVVAFALEGDADPAELSSNEVEVTWPPRSGRRILVPELDRAAWFDLPEATSRILPGQRVFLDRLTALLGQVPMARSPTSHDAS